MGLENRKDLSVHESLSMLGDLKAKGNVFYGLDATSRNEIEKSIGGKGITGKERTGHKYIRREWNAKKGSWEYIYRDKNGKQYAADEPKAKESLKSDIKEGKGSPVKKDEDYILKRIETLSWTTLAKHYDKGSDKLREAIMKEAKRLGYNRNILILHGSQRAYKEKYGDKKNVNKPEKTSDKIMIRKKPLTESSVKNKTIVPKEGQKIKLKDDTVGIYLRWGEEERRGMIPREENLYFVKVVEKNNRRYWNVAIETAPGFYSNKHQYLIPEEKMIDKTNKTAGRETNKIRLTGKARKYEESLYFYATEEDENDKERIGKLMSQLTNEEKQHAYINALANIKEIENKDSRSEYIRRLEKYNPEKLKAGSIDAKIMRAYKRITQSLSEMGADPSDKYVIDMIRNHIKNTYGNDVSNNEIKEAIGK